MKWVQIILLLVVGILGGAIILATPVAQYDEDDPVPQVPQDMFYTGPSAFVAEEEEGEGGIVNNDEEYDEGMVKVGEDCSSTTEAPMSDSSIVEEDQVQDAYSEGGRRRVSAGGANLGFSNRNSVRSLTLDDGDVAPGPSAPMRRAEKRVAAAKNLTAKPDNSKRVAAPIVISVGAPGLVPPALTGGSSGGAPAPAPPATPAPGRIPKRPPPNNTLAGGSRLGAPNNITRMPTPKSPPKGPTDTRRITGFNSIIGKPDNSKGGAIVPGAGVSPASPNTMNEGSPGGPAPNTLAQQTGPQEVPQSITVPQGQQEQVQAPAVNTFASGASGNGAQPSSSLPRRGSKYSKYKKEFNDYETGGTGIMDLAPPTTLDNRPEGSNNNQNDNANMPNNADMEECDPSKESAVAHSTSNKGKAMANAMSIKCGGALANATRGSQAGALAQSSGSGDARANSETEGAGGAASFANARGSGKATGTSASGGIGNSRSTALSNTNDALAKSSSSGGGDADSTAQSSTGGSAKALSKTLKGGTARSDADASGGGDAKATAIADEGGAAKARSSANRQGNAKSNSRTTNGDGQAEADAIARDTGRAEADAVSDFGDSNADSVSGAGGENNVDYFNQVQN